jgi:hypothetical protein
MTQARGEPISARILVVLIHHEDQQRVAAAQSTVSAVAEAMGIYGDVQIREVARQPDWSSVGGAVVAGRHVRQWMLERRWASYLGVSGRWVLSAGLLGLRLTQLLLPRTRAKADRRAFVELALAAKHTMAWRLAHEERFDLLIVLEDDARADESSIGRIRQLVDRASADGTLSRAHVDLAGGISQRELRMSTVMEPLGDGLLRMRRAGTNTACGYLLGQEVVAGLVALITTDPTRLRLPADWLLNDFFLHAARSSRSVEVDCLHSSPHALSHGSFTGAVTSSIR